MEVGGWLWVLDVIGAVVLAAVLIYGMANWRKRRVPKWTTRGKRRCAKIIVAAAKDHKAALGDIYNAALAH